MKKILLVTLFVFLAGLTAFPAAAADDPFISGSEECEFDLGMFFSDILDIISPAILAEGEEGEIGLMAIEKIGLREMGILTYESVLNDDTITANCSLKPDKDIDDTLMGHFMEVPPSKMQVTRFLEEDRTLALISVANPHLYVSAINDWIGTDPFEGKVPQIPKDPLAMLGMWGIDREQVWDHFDGELSVFIALPEGELNPAEMQDGPPVAICLSVNDGLKIKEMMIELMASAGDETAEIAEYFSSPGDKVGEFSFYDGPDGEGSLGFSDDWIVFTNNLNVLGDDFANPPGKAARFDSNVYMYANLDVLVHDVLGTMLEMGEFHGEDKAMMEAIVNTDADLGAIELTKIVKNGRIEAELTMNREVLTAYYQMMLGMIHMGIQEELGMEAR